MAGAERKEILEVPFESMLSTINDFENYPKFVTGMKRTRILETTPNGKKVEFEVDMMKRFTYTVLIQETVDPSRQSAEVSWNMVSSDFLKGNVGGWKLKALGPTQTEVTYHLDLEFGMAVPGFVLKGLISKSLPLAIQEFCKQAKARS